MNNDLISRQILFKKLRQHKELFCRNRIEFLGLSKNDKARVDEIDSCIATVINMPSAQPEPQWIPVSERLPEEDKDVLVTVYFAGLTQKHKTGWNDHIKPSTYVDIASYFGGDWSSASDEYKVAAWMPLPEPYRAERRTDDQSK